MSQRSWGVTDLNIWGTVGSCPTVDVVRLTPKPAATQGSWVLLFGQGRGACKCVQQPSCFFWCVRQPHAHAKASYRQEQCKGSSPASPSLETPSFTPCEVLCMFPGLHHLSWRPPGTPDGVSGDNPTWQLSPGTLSPRACLLIS